MHSGHVYDDKAIFFQDEKVLFAGIVDLKIGASQTWQFSFRLPEQTESDGAQTKIKRKKRYESFLMTPHPLPQSTALSGQLPHQWQALVRTPFMQRFRGSGVGGRIEELSRSSPNHAVTPRLPISGAKQTVHHSSSRLLPEEAQRKRSVTNGSVTN